MSTAIRRDSNPLPVQEPARAPSSEPQRTADASASRPAASRSTDGFDASPVRAATSLPKTGNAFIDRVSGDAVRSQRETGVPASVTLAQAILESGWGKSGLSRQANNFFGIKGEGPAGHTTMRTREVLHGREVYVNANFRKYNSPAESFTDHGRFLRNNPRYAQAFKHTDDPARFAAEIHKAGYATDPNYAKQLTGIINRYGLGRFDQAARSGASPTPFPATPAPAPTPAPDPSSPANPQPPAAASSSGLDQVASGRSLVKLGQQGETVKQVQQMLGMTGASADGIFGPGTELAVRRFQRNQGIQVDGLVGPETLAALRNPSPLLGQSASGAQVEQLQRQLGQAGFDPGQVDGRFGPKTEAAVNRFQQALGLDVDGIAGPRTFQALGQAASNQTPPSPPPSSPTLPSSRPPPSPPASPAATTGTPGTAGSGAVDPNNPILRKLATSPLNDGPTGYCVAVTRANMQRLGIPNLPGATGNDPNNPRGAMVQMLRNGGWDSVPLPGARQQTIRSPYGTVTANVVSADQYRKLVAQGKVPDGAVIFQTRHGWDWNGGSHGNDMGIVRDHGRTTHNYKSMPSIVYSDCKDVVLLVPKGALQ